MKYLLLAFTGVLLLNNFNANFRNTGILPGWMVWTGILFFSGISLVGIFGFCRSLNQNRRIPE